MKHHPRKRFGQNFLQDKAIIHKILSALNLQENDNIVEIGPGLGALTEPLLRQLKRLTAIEIDTDLQAHLTAMPAAMNKLHLIAGDALTVDFSQLGKHLRVIGNLPYNISTPLLLHLLDYAPLIEDMHFMLQKEVVLRMSANPGTKAFGRLSVMLQYRCDVEYLFDVPPEAFYPQPKVDSAIVRLTPYLNSPYPEVDVSALEPLVAQAFSMRRKTLANNLKSVLSAAQLTELGIDPGLRPEQLSIKDYVQIAKFVSN
ncbi:16S rRNA (adenine(1518)-N(6)/adenine(1519)-N(6))-dimethyltransferase RsmA [Legionella hackeliae]|uniref:Ribosomal RNA small subunit methyltransferase A n=1 Tax=Legionella hackeliae TaxID=449 RepID=A0A0A8UZK1_LEGHA|nr:16S rRNA (adenine(1518)-N(6)/adenine(1519)-N(6))-dimethyltransferase RsmA [Legionella hackeliae]KTD12756.1 dimethyladenosine transferase [Legionella hackeliae]CEK12179.1 Ribosomal RNA small subunit methyltransferase A [Legionella hackeliae]STX48965.1 dimethyladenosine transferase [Legionella hackeliae]